MTFIVSDQERRAEQFQAVRLECRIMIFDRFDCDCSDFWARNGSRLVPEIIQMAEDKMLDPLEYFADYAKDIHDKHLDDGVIFT